MTAVLSEPRTDDDVPDQRSRRPLRLAVRLHFYAGILVGPFLLVAAVTGLLYTVAPQIDQVAYGDVLRAGSSTGAPLALEQQVAAAQAAQPGLDVASVRVGEGRDSTQVVFDDPALVDDRQRTVYVDPWTGAVRGTLVTWFGSTPAVTWLDDLHRNLLLGDLGRHYSEIAASWLWIVALGGVLLWLRRRRESNRLRRTLLPEMSARGRRRVLSLHGTVGLGLVVGLLFLSATGLTWSRFAGENFSAVLTDLNAHAPALDTALPGGVAVSSDLTSDPTRVLDGARAAGLDGPLVLTPPSDGGAWTVTQDDSRWPIRLDSAAVDGQTGDVTAVNPWGDRPLLSKLSNLGVNAHMGILFGPVNQLILASVAVGLLLVMFWGYRAWWQRRPTREGSPVRVGRAPKRGTWREVHPVVLAVGALVTGFLCWAMPLFGVTLVGFLIVDAALHVVRRQAVAAARVPQQSGRAQAEDSEEELLV